MGNVKLYACRSVCWGYKIVYFWGGEAVRHEKYLERKKAHEDLEEKYRQNVLAEHGMIDKSEITKMVSNVGMEVKK